MNMKSTDARPPSLIVLAGPNGVGKSTAAPAVLRGRLGVPPFVDADAVARGLAGFAPATVAMQAGRIMLARLKELAATRADFGFETTLAGRSFAPWLKSLIAAGIQNLARLYQPLATSRRLYNAEKPSRLRVAFGTGVKVDDVIRPDLWRIIERQLKGDTE